ncbi:ABC transporter permease [Arthrobacter sp. GCM10027362]|uniref:ABC transporter permease n=1 Tax=Arthrobacter sp. GCM10027362 TaxID=3273379 RepID=UPI00363F35FC
MTSVPTAQAAAPKPARKTARVRRSGPTRAFLLAVEIGVPVLLILAWWTLSASSTNAFFPPLAEILVRFRELWLFDHMLSDVLPSLGNLVAGFGIAVAAGLAAGFLLAGIKPLSWLADPLIHFWRAIPPVAVVPIFVAVLGYGNETRVFSIVLAAVFPTLIATVDGLRSVDPLLRDVGRSYRLSGPERIFQLNLPAASPMIFSGIQVSLQNAFIVMVASEMLGPSTGIGGLTLLAQQSFATADMWAGILLLGFLGYAANALFDLAKTRILSWYFDAQKLGAS